MALSVKGGMKMTSAEKGMKKGLKKSGQGGYGKRYEKTYEIQLVANRFLRASM